MRGSVLSEQTRWGKLVMNDVTAASDAEPKIPQPSELVELEVSPARLEASRIVGFSSRDSRSRSFNLLRSQITKRLAALDAKLLGVTSAAPASGKSFISLNLAAALSRLSDRSVYLFDFDLRRGTLANELGLVRGGGLGPFLAGETDDLRELGCRVGPEGFAFFPCYPELEGSAELFVGGRFSALISALRRLPDNAIVICDLPPAFANDDTILITQQLDAFLMVIEQGKTTRKQVSGTLDLLRPTPCIGSVLNRYEGGWADPYGYGYGDAYAKYYG